MDSKTAQSELQQFTASRKSAGDYYKQSQEELGVGGAKDTQESLKGLIRNTEKQLAGVGESVAGRTRGNLVTEAQRARLQNLETQPIAQTLGTQQTQYSDAAQQYQNLLGQAGTQAGMSYQTDADKAAALEANYNRLFTQEQTAAEAERQRQQFEESRMQSNRQFEEMKRQFEATQNATRNQYAQQASLYNQQRTDSKADQEAEAARQEAIQNEALAAYNRQTNAARSDETQKILSSLPQFQTGNFIKDYGSSIGKYGPLALIGKGWGW